MTKTRWDYKGMDVITMRVVDQYNFFVACIDGLMKLTDMCAAAFRKLLVKKSNI